MKYQGRRRTQLGDRIIKRLTDRQTDKGGGGERKHMSERQLYRREGEEGREEGEEGEEG